MCVISHCHSCQPKTYCSNTQNTLNNCMKHHLLSAEQFQSRYVWQGSGVTLGLRVILQFITDSVSTVFFLFFLDIWRVGISIFGESSGYQNMFEETHLKLHTNILHRLWNALERNLTQPCVWVRQNRCLWGKKNSTGSGFAIRALTFESFCCGQGAVWLIVFTGLERESSWCLLS